MLIEPLEGFVLSARAKVSSHELQSAMAEGPRSEGMTYLNLTLISIDHLSKSSSL